ncbi:hypothetical protein NDU88_001701 [Pleurodeles waltl]|uniref:Uncharacterized protein n=1 Tax=Pleurodeles waltl TaxID=8319 RepID=A0AAV7KSM2_PLEWA|nr:hypothetical protein NDU88_001701 [Pleurodeles waltl]
MLVTAGNALVTAKNTENADLLCRPWQDLARAPCVVGDRSDFIKANVESMQNTQKRYFDNKKGAKESFIAEGDCVVIKLPTFVKKGNAKPEPVKVELVSGNAVRVEGNKWWNKSKVVKLRREFDPQFMSRRALVKQSDLDQSGGDGLGLRRSNRVRQLPWKLCQ